MKMCRDCHFYYKWYGQSATSEKCNHPLLLDSIDGTGPHPADERSDGEGQCGPEGKLHLHQQNKKYNREGFFSGIYR